MKDRRPVSLGERWRRETTRGIDDQRIAAALDVLPGIRRSMVVVGRGSVRAELEGSMGSIHEVSVQVRTLPARGWPAVIHVLRRSASILEALEKGRVPRSLDRLVARVMGEPLFPEARSITTGCSCDLHERPCHHVLALLELIARRLDERPYELLILRGTDARTLLEGARSGPGPQEIANLPFGAREEPVLYPEGEDEDLDSALSARQSAWLLGLVSPRAVEAAMKALERLERSRPPSSVATPEE
ncbi:MAG: hypothetical protein Fur0037_00340 [Planctomycetota bacterium]